jgi:multiple sugar transport system ATP-binding protein
VQLGESGPAFELPRARRLSGAADGASVLLGLRPEHMARSSGAPGEGAVRYDATIELIQPTGSRSYATFRLGGKPVMAELKAHDVSRPGEKLPIDINLMRASLFDAASEKAIF